MKILLMGCFRVANNGNIYGGAEKSIIKLANWLAENTDHAITLVSVEGEVQPYEISDKVTFQGYPLLQNGKLSVHWQMYQNTVRAIKTYRPDIAVSFWIHPALYAFMYDRNLKLIFSEQNDPRLEYGIMSRLARSIVLKKAKGIVFQTQDAQNYFKEKIRRKSMVIHNPIYVSKTNGVKMADRDSRIVTVGRLERQKNQEMLIRAFCQIKDRYPDLTLEIYGEGSLRNELQGLIDEMNLKERVCLKGTCPNVLERIRSARLFVLPSLYEGMPNTLMEAMSMGIPAISSDCPCGGPRELIDDKVNGYLFKNTDMESLVSVMTEVLDHPDESVSREEQKICDTHSQDIIFSLWKDYIERCWKSE